MGCKSSKGALTRQEMETAITDLLKSAAQMTCDELGAKDGFFNHPQRKIGLPPRIQKLFMKVSEEKTNELEMKINHVAENAVKASFNLLLELIDKMTFLEPAALIHGAKNAASSFLKASSDKEFQERFKAILDKELEGQGVAKMLDGALAVQRGADKATEVVSNAAGAVMGMFSKDEKKAEEKPKEEETPENMSEYLREKASVQMWKLLGEKETMIRGNPAHHKTGVMQTAFGK